MMNSERLQKFMARAGIASRRKCEEYIAEGRVRVNGVSCQELGTKVFPDKDVVECDGKRVMPPLEQVVIVLNKPEGYLTSMSDRFNRPCVSELVPTDEYAGLFPVGRLDRDTTGVLLFTTDGELGHALCHPSRQVAKRYRATVEGIVTEHELDALRGGVLLEDGMTSPAVCTLLETEHVPYPHSEVAIEIHEGRKRQVKRMCEAIGHKVQKLDREQFGPISKGELESGTWRLLTESEIAQLTSACESK